MKVPFLDLSTPHRSLADEILGSWSEILNSGCFIGGQQVESFESEFAAVCGTKYAVAVGSGTDALRFIFLALNLEPGDEVITVANTFIATTEAIHQAGGRAVFVDVHPRTYTLDPERIEAAITSRTRGIVPVHLYGQPAAMGGILEIANRHGLWVVEDAAQAHLAEYNGRQVGSFGIASAFSFYPGKNLGACGEAGAVTTDDEVIARKVRMLRDHGQSRKYFHEVEGYNGRCDALQAAALRIKLKHLPDWSEARRRVAARYLDRLRGVEGVVLPTVPEGTLPVWHLFVVQVNERDRIAVELSERGIGVAFHYPVPLYAQPAYQWLEVDPGSLPVTGSVCSRVLSLPIYPEMTHEMVDAVCDALIECISQREARAALAP